MSEIKYCDCNPDCGCRKRAEIELRKQIQRVRELHKEHPSENFCLECDSDYPCDTIDALDGVQS